MEWPSVAHQGIGSSELMTTSKFRHNFTLSDLQEGGRELRGGRGRDERAHGEGQGEGCT